MTFNNSSQLNSTGLPPAFAFPKLPNDEIEVISSTVVYTLLAVMIVSGNSLVIAAYRYNHRLQTVTNAFLVGLAVSDLLVGLVSVPLWVYYSVCQQSHSCSTSQGLSVFYATVDIFAGCASVLQLTAISLERFIAITRPISHRAYSPNFYNAMIISAWIYAFGIAVLFPVQVTRWEKVYTVILVSTCFAIPTALIFIVYVMIFKTAMFSSESRVSPEGNYRRTVQQEAKIAVTIAVITGLFVMAWLPFFVVVVIGTFCIKCLPAYPGVLRMVRFIKWMHYSNSMVNPIIYAYRNRDMRRTFVRILRLVFCHCMNSNFDLASNMGRSIAGSHRSRMRNGYSNNSVSLKAQNNKGATINGKNHSQDYADRNPAINRVHEPFDSGVQSGEGQNSNHSDLASRNVVHTIQAYEIAGKADVLVFRGVDTICEAEGIESPNQINISCERPRNPHIARTRETMFASMDNGI